MPLEQRQIVFSRTEVMEAMLAQLRRKGVPLPRGKVVGTTISGDAKSGPAFVVRVACEAVSGPDVMQDLQLAGSELAAALIAYCRDRGIPLPRNTAKRLDLVEGQLALGMTIGGKPA